MAKLGHQDKFPQVLNHALWFAFSQTFSPIGNPCGWLDEQDGDGSISDFINEISLGEFFDLGSDLQDIWRHALEHGDIQKLTKQLAVHFQKELNNQSGEPTKKVQEANNA